MNIKAAYKYFIIHNKIYQLKEKDCHEILF